MTRTTARALDRRTLLRLGVAAPAAVAGTAVVGGSLSAASAAPTFDRALATGLDYPWGIDFLPDGNALVTERNSGRVFRVSATGGGKTEVGRIAGVYNNGGEGGLMGLALSPGFATDRWVYLFQTTETDNRVIRVKYENGALGFRQSLLRGIPRANTHNGGGLWFTGVITGTPSLWVTTGDTRRPELAQSKSSLAGKVLRLKMDGTAQAGNPFGNRVYSFGHRNPEGITIDPSRRMWISELGENRYDELNQVRSGRNFGWPRAEGSDGAGVGYTDPYVQWSTDECSPSGLAILGGSAWVGALRGQSLWQVDLESGARTKRRWFNGQFGRIRNVKKAPDGSLWLTTSNGGGTDRVLRVTV